MTPAQDTDPVSPQHRDRPWAHGERRQMVAELLTAEILQGKLQAGTRLVIKDLANRYDVSPTPVREALVSLEGIGIVNVSPNRGAVVRELSPIDAIEIGQVRTALECEATRLACNRIPAATLHELQVRFQLLEESSEFTKRHMQTSRDLDTQLHDAIAGNCGNRFLQQELGRMMLLFRGVRDISWEQMVMGAETDRTREEIREHLQIVKCLLAGEAEAASKAMAEHIEAGIEYWKRALTSE